MLVLFLGVLLHKYGEMGENLRKIRGFPRNVMSQVRALNDPGPEHITIDIKHKHMEKIIAQRNNAMRQGMLVAGEDDYVPAEIRYKDRSLPVRLRLKGDWIYHFDTNKWSFRIRVKGSESLFGMKQFSIQHPKTRRYLYEWLFHKALKREGVLALHYDFISVTQNGKYLGIYALEEHFGRHVLENNGRRYGPIIRFNEDLYWKEKGQQQKKFRAVENRSGSYFASDIDAFHTNEILSDPALYSQFLRASSLLESFRRRESRASDVFDIEALARLFAVVDLMGAQNAVDWRDLRFYYDPITSKLEPIGWDGYGGHPIKAIVAHCGLIEPRLGCEGMGPPPYDLLANLFSDAVFHEHYIGALERIAERAYLDKFFGDVEAELNRKMAILRSEFREFEFSKGILYRNQEYIRTVLNPVKALHAYYYDASQGQLEVEVGNIQGMPVEVMGVVINEAVTVEVAEEMVLPGRPLDRPVDYRVARFPLPTKRLESTIVPGKLKLLYSLVGSQSTKHESVFPWPWMARDHLQTDFLTERGNVEKFPFVVVDGVNKEIVLKRGVWEVRETVVFPKGYTVRGGEGVRFNLSHGAKVVSYSPLQLIGSQDDPIVIYSDDSTGQGLLLLNSSEESALSHVVFRNLSSPVEKGWEPTGAVTIYNSAIDLSECHFIELRSEDALNLVRSTFTITGSSFLRNRGDALDVDSSSGSVSSTQFLHSGKSAIELSGSIVDFQDIDIRDAPDNGIRASERSQVNLLDVALEGGNVAVTSADLSVIAGANVSITDFQVGIAAYARKSESRRAEVTMRGLTVSRVDTEYLIEHGSSVVIDGNAVQDKKANIASLLDSKATPE
jgi:hypothetical protein